MLDLLFGPRRSALGASRPQARQHGRSRTRAGTVVDEEIALTYAAVWACTRAICETIAALPVQVIERTSNDERKQNYDLPAYKLLHKSPNDRMGITPFMEGRLLHQVNWGNGFAEIERTYGGEPHALWPVHVKRVSPMLDGSGGYRIKQESGGSDDVPAANMCHLPGTLSEDGIWGKGVIQNAREAIGFGLGTERHGATFFGSGGQPKGVVTAPGMKDPEVRRTFRAEWKDVHGSPDSAEIAILPPESRFTPISLSMEDSQFLETRKHNDVVIAQWYGVPLHMVKSMGAATRNNIEQTGIEFVIYTLLPWCRRSEGEWGRKLLTHDQQLTFSIEYVLSGLLRGDISSRMAAYVVAIANGIMTINEVRRLENLNGIGEAGDQNYVQLNMTTAQRMFEEPAKTINATSANVGFDPAKPAPDEGAVEPVVDKDMKIDLAVAAIQTELTGDRLAAARVVLKAALARWFTKEANAARQKLKDKQRDPCEWHKAFSVTNLKTVLDGVGPACELYAAAGRPLDPLAVARACTEASAAALSEAYNLGTPAQLSETLDQWAAVLSEQVTAQLLGESNAAA